MTFLPPRPPMPPFPGPPVPGMTFPPHLNIPPPPMHNFPAYAPPGIPGVVPPPALPPFPGAVPMFLPPGALKMKPSKMKPSKRPPPDVPQKTLYIHNLNESIPLEVVKNDLIFLCSQYGQVLQVTVKGAAKMKGQAFVVMEDQEGADKCKQALQNYPLHGRLIDIQYARMKSDVTAKMDGTLEENKRLREEAKAHRILEEAEEKPVAVAEPTKESPQEPQQGYGFPFVAAEGPPHNILLIQNIPQGVTGAQLKEVFSKYGGFVDVRTVEAKKDIAFVDFDNEIHAAVARAANQQLKMNGSLVKVTFAKK